MSAAPDDFATYDFRGETEFMEIFVHPEAPLIVAVRKQGVPMPAEDVMRAHQELLSFAPQPQRWHIIIDTRPVTGNNDTRFEAAISRVNDLLLGHFVRIAILVRSYIGQLHAARLSAVDQRVFIGSNPALLLASLLQQDA